MTVPRGFKLSLGWLGSLAGTVAAAAIIASWSGLIEWGNHRQSIESLRAQVARLQDAMDATEAVRADTLTRIALTERSVTAVANAQVDILSEMRQNREVLDRIRSDVAGLRADLSRIQGEREGEKWREDWYNRSKPHDGGGE